MLRNPSLWQYVLATTSLRSRRTQPFINVAVASSQVGNLDSCSQLRVILKENTSPEAEQARSKGSNVLFLHLGKTPQPNKTYGFFIQIRHFEANLILAKTSKRLGVYPIVEEKCVCKSQAFWANSGGVLGSAVPRTACLLAPSVARCLLSPSSSGP